MKKVFVSGCYDLLHSGHVAFFKEAASYGQLYVGLGADSTLQELKGRSPINSESERLYMVKAVRYVTDAWISRGAGYLDFQQEFRDLKPDVFIVNEDGNSLAKADLCRELGVEYVVLKRVPEPGLTARSTTKIRQSDKCLLPYRLDLAGAWIDQPYVSKLGAGWAITISLEPIVQYNERSGMATSTRNVARKYWPQQLPLQEPGKLAEMMFRLENGPERTIVSGAQDAIGICMPGLTRHFYDKQYWPTKIESNHDDETLSWLERHVQMIPLWPREPGLDLLTSACINKENVSKLTNAAGKCWEPILNQDLETFAYYFQKSFEAQTKLFPNMVNPKIQRVINEYKDKTLACKLTGAGGGGYIIAVVDEPIDDVMDIKIRRRDEL